MDNIWAIEVAMVVVDGGPWETADEDEDAEDDDGVQGAEETPGTMRRGRYMSRDSVYEDT